MFALLKSQESLLQRLQHLVHFSQKLTLIVGAEGSGKTTFATLLSELNFNTAYVLCPMHADSSEIREKILLQLFSKQSFFDCDKSLSEIILTNISELHEDVHIIIDDIHYLPLEVLAECMVLNQVKLSNVTFHVTMTAKSGFQQNLLTQLAQKQRSLILPIEIDPLSLSERESLYNNIVRDNGVRPTTSISIVKKILRQQHGTPKEVIQLATNESSMLEPEVKPKINFKKVGFATTLFCAFCLVFLVVFIESKTKTEPVEAEIKIPREIKKLESPVKSITIKDEVVKNAPEIDTAPEIKSIATVTIDTKDKAQTNLQVIDTKAETQTNLQTIRFSILPKNILNITSKPNWFTKIIPLKEDITETLILYPLSSSELLYRKIIESTLNENNIANVVEQNQAVLTADIKLPQVEKPKIGFTVQLISSKNIDTVKNLIAKIGVRPLYLLTRNSWYILTYGNFTTKPDALKAKKQVEKSYKLDSRLREWKQMDQNLKDYYGVQ